MTRGTVAFKGWLNLGVAELATNTVDTGIKIPKSSLPFVRRNSLLKKLFACSIHH